MTLEANPGGENFIFTRVECQRMVESAQHMNKKAHTIRDFYQAKMGNIES